MKVIESRTPPSKWTRDEWIDGFRSHCNPEDILCEEPTTYRDGGAAVRFRFKTGDVLEWEWATTHPVIAAREAREHGATKPVVAKTSPWDALRGGMSTIIGPGGRRR